MTHFIYAEEIRKQNPNLYMVRVDFDSLLTNITLDYTIGISVGSLDNDNEIPPKIFKLNLLSSIWCC